MQQENGHSPRQVLITGGSGFIGRHLVRALLARGDQVTVLSRDRRRTSARLGPQVTVIETLEQLADDSRIDAVVNLAGAAIIGPPWTPARRRRLRDSRLRTTAAIVALCQRLRRPPQVLVSASAIGFYGAKGEPADEQTASPDSFQARLCRDWEAAAQVAAGLGLRVPLLRFGIVLGRDGGALPALALPARLGLGAVLGDGRQGMPWLHIADAVGLVLWCLDNPALTGPVNAVSPEQTTQGDFMRALGRTLRRPVWLRAPAWILRSLLGEMAELFVDGRKVLPTVAVRDGYGFSHPQLDAALADLLGPR